MENNSDRMGFALIALSVVAFVLLAVNGPLKSTVNGFFNGFQKWQTQTFDGINESNKPDVTHTAYAYSSDGTDRFTTVYPNENLAALSTLAPWGSAQNDTIEKTMQKVTIHSSGTSYFGFSTFDGNTFTPDTRFYVQFDFKPTSGVVTSIGGHCIDTFALVEKIKINGQTMDTGNWQDGIPYTFTNGQVYHIEFEAVTKNNYNAGIPGLFIQPNRSAFGTAYDAEITHLKLEKQSRTIYTPAPTDDYINAYPKYIGTYTDKNESASQKPSDYTWKLNHEYHE